MKIVRWAAALPAALVALAVLQPVSHAESAKPPKKVTTVVSLTFDDGDATHTATARMLEKRGMRGTFYINTDTIGRDAKLTRRELAAIAKAGHEIGGHTLTHIRLTELTRSEQRTQICDDRRALVAWGYRPTTLAYPFGSVDADAKAVARQCGYDAARRVGGLKDWGCRGCQAGEDLRPRDRYEIRTPGSIRDDTLPRQMRQQVLNAEKSGGGLVALVFHQVCDGCGLYSVSPKVLDEFLGWLAARESHGTVVKTLHDAVGARYRPVPAE
ncbi:polysaccharide deacetylase family protein [Streptosporangium roseum]|uniref:polysaccharide deacetylase family protein n=1 Tax=Streptosporangium roseum TaxID=2001 RepID=UPI003321C06B